MTARRRQRRRSRPYGRQSADLPSSLSARTKHLMMLQALLPPGIAWTREPGKVLTRLLDGFSGLFATIDKRAEDLIYESDPTTTTEMLEDWERVTGLPDPCLGPGPSEAIRRERLRTRLIPPETCNPSDIISLAASLGYQGCTIQELDTFRCTSQCTESLYSEDSIFSWVLVVPATANIQHFTTQSRCTDQLAGISGHELLECVIRETTPIHTEVMFAYGGSIL